MISIKKSTTADTRSCDFSRVTRSQLHYSTLQHREDVTQGLEFFSDRLLVAAAAHDDDKLNDLDGFLRDFQGGFKSTEWWDNHRKINRHHLMKADGVPKDVNLVDVLEMIADCVMAGMGRTGEVYDLHLCPELLEKAFQNTVELLKANVQVES